MRRPPLVLVVLVGVLAFGGAYALANGTGEESQPGVRPSPAKIGEAVPAGPPALRAAAPLPKLRPRPARARKSKPRPRPQRRTRTRTRRRIAAERPRVTERRASPAPAPAPPPAPPPDAGKKFFGSD